MEACTHTHTHTLTNTRMLSHTQFPAEGLTGRADVFRMRMVIGQSKMQNNWQLLRRPNGH